MSAQSSFCPKCGQPFDASRATYDTNGNLQCNECAAKGQIALGESRAATSVVSAAWGVLGSAIASFFCFNPFGLLSLAAVVSGAGWLAMVGSNQSLKDSMGSRYMTSMIVTILGIVIAGLALAIAGLKTLGIVLSL